jgi:hypothetical protein
MIGDVVDVGPLPEQSCTIFKVYTDGKTVGFG